MVSEPAIEVRGLRREFGDTVAVRDVTFSIERGAVLALVGPNGAGKTTLLRMLAALLLPSRGTVRLLGHDVLVEPRVVHQNVGFLPDFFGLYDELRVREYLKYFCLAYRLDAQRALSAQANALAVAGLTNLADAPIESLSRGMRQKLGLARTLLHDPAVLLLDEPAAGLDPAARQEMQRLLCALSSQGKTIVVSSHILAELSDYSTHVAVLDKGRLVFAGSLLQARQALGRGRRFQLRARGSLEPVLATLASFPGVSQVAVQGDRVDFDLAGDDEAAAALLSALVSGKAQLFAFGEAKSTMQDTYLSLMGGAP